VTAPRKVIIDTDPGVDDALALLFAMCSPELKIEAITVVAGNVRVELGLQNALRMVQIAGRSDIRVSAGASTPLERRLVTWRKRLGRTRLPYSYD
jgi:purine nucleosidase